MKYMFFFLCLQMACGGQRFQVRSARHLDVANQKFMIGPVIARDYKTPKSTALDLRELYIFEMMKSGISILNLSIPSAIKEIEIRKERSSLPSSLRNIAGENHNVQFVSERLLEKTEIQSLFVINHFDYFIQGVISIHAAAMDSQQKQDQIIFLNVYDKEGNVVEMIHSGYFDESIRASEQLRKVAAALAENTLGAANR